VHVYFKRLAPYFASLARYSLTSNSRSRSGFTSLRAKVFPYSAARFVAPRQSIVSVPAALHTPKEPRAPRFQLPQLTLARIRLEVGEKLNTNKRFITGTILTRLPQRRPPTLTGMHPADPCPEWTGGQRLVLLTAQRSGR